MLCVMISFYLLHLLKSSEKLFLILLQNILQSKKLVLGQFAIIDPGCFFFFHLEIHLSSNVTHLLFFSKLNNNKKPKSVAAWPQKPLPIHKLRSSKLSNETVIHFSYANCGATQNPSAVIGN